MLTRRIALPWLLSTALLLSPAAAVERGAVVPYFKATDVLGKPVSLGELVARKRVAVLFWDWRRATSVRAMQTLDRLQAAYGNSGLTVVAIEGEGTGAEGVVERVEKLRAIGIPQRYTVVPDPGGRIARQFRVDGTPRVYLLDGAGRVFEHLEDFRAEDELLLEARVRELLGLLDVAPARPEVAAPTAAAPVPPVPPVAVPPPPPVAPTPVGNSSPAQDLRERYRYFGSYHLNRNEPAKAEEYLRKLIALQPDGVEGWLHLGEACARQGKYDEAREAWEQVLRLEPRNAEADDNIRRLVRGEY